MVQQRRAANVGMPARFDRLRLQLAKTVALALPVKRGELVQACDAHQGHAVVLGCERDHTHACPSR